MHAHACVRARVGGTRPGGGLTIFARIVRIFGGESLVLGGWDVCAPLRERRRGGFIKGAGQ